MSRRSCSGLKQLHCDAEQDLELCPPHGVVRGIPVEQCLLIMNFEECLL